MVRRRQDFFPVFSAPSATTQEATTLSQTAQPREARTTSTTTLATKLKQAHTSTTGACMLDRSRACARWRVAVPIFLARVVVLACRLETRRRSPRRSTRLIVATLHEKILRSDTHWIAVQWEIRLFFIFRNSFYTKLPFSFPLWSKDLAPGGQADTRTWGRWRAVNFEIHLWSSGMNVDCIWRSISIQHVQIEAGLNSDPEMIPFGTKSVTLSMLIDLLTSTCRSTQVKITSTDLWPQEMFTFSEMLALV